MQHSFHLVEQKKTQFEKLHEQCIKRLDACSNIDVLKANVQECRDICADTIAKAKPIDEKIEILQQLTHGIKNLEELTQLHGKHVNDVYESCVKRIQFAACVCKNVCYGVSSYEDSRACETMEEKLRT